jgi:hypothetical protein
MFKDAVINEITLHFSFADRLRVLLGSKVRVRVVSRTEHLVGEVEGSSTARVDRLFPPKRKGGYEAVDK